MGGGKMTKNEFKMLVVSDSHGDRKILENLLNHYQKKIDLFIHCGDSELPETDKLFETYQVVAGNCDYDSAFKSDQLILYENERIWITHGHHYQVNFGLERLALAARQQRVDFCFFGHTHQLGFEMHNNCLFLNPGSISLPRGNYANLGGTYAIVTVNPQAIGIQYYKRNFQPVTELRGHFKKFREK